MEIKVVVFIGVTLILTCLFGCTDGKFYFVFIFNLQVHSCSLVVLR